MKIIISGAGIGGLTTALCCIHHGMDVTLLERAPELGEVGAGIQIPPNAMKVLQALGVDDAITEKAFQPKALEARMGVSGQQLFSLPLNEKTLTRWGAPYLHIHRADYIAVLAAALHNKAPQALRLDAQLTGYQQDATGVSVQLANGETLRADALIGADGIHSVIRETMLGPQASRFTGNVAWRAVVPVENLGDLAPRPTACVWMGAGKHAVTYRLRGGKLANLVAVVERDDWASESRSESWVERGSQEQALADFNGWHPTITEMLGQTEELYRWALFDRAPLPQWTDGRVALLGDAAHPMLPFMAQGAAMAVEDAWALAQKLAGSNDVPRSLQAYQTQRQARASRVQALSRANGKTFHRKSALSQVATYGPMWLAGKLAPTAIQARQDWLYGHDVTLSQS